MKLTEQETRHVNNIKRLKATILKTSVDEVDSLESKFLLLDDEKRKLQEGMAVTE